MKNILKLNAITNWKRINIKYVFEAKRSVGIRGKVIEQLVSVIDYTRWKLLTAGL